MTEDICGRFDALCAEGARLNCVRDSDEIGTYNEKRLHKILKRAFCGGDGCFEVKIGSYTADVLCGGEIIEIQTGSLYPLAQKIKYFLSNTDYSVTVVHPLICELTLIRIDGETGEVIRKKRSPKKETPTDALCELYWLREYFGNGRLKILMPLVSGEEYRFSERVRYRKKGAYDAEFFPLKMLGIADMSTVERVREALPETLYGGDGYSVKELERIFGLRGRRLALALKFLAELNISEREKIGNKYIYRFCA